MVGESAGRVLSKVPLSNNTISHGIQHMAEDLNDQLIEKKKGKEFRLQLDEAMDNNKDAHLICCSWFVDDWTKCVAVCTDGDRSVSGCYEGLQALIRSKALYALWNHCMINSEALASKNLSPPLDLVMESLGDLTLPPYFTLIVPTLITFIRFHGTLYTPLTHIIAIVME
ncbi:zinc finger MYM-type protein 6-like [Tachypleus tridentatus]|uniref:zinc finger MYM-type protein 6-like n=1 Tax=Tachypleus tridentatus TaxID=6853 RepID=UPI003FCF203B